VIAFKVAFLFVEPSSFDSQLPVGTQRDLYDALESFAACAPSVSVFVVACETSDHQTNFIACNLANHDLLDAIHDFTPWAAWTVFLRNDAQDPQTQW